MSPKEINFKRDHKLFRIELTNTVDHRHTLVTLSHQIDWQAFSTEFSLLYAESKRHPGVPIRLMVGLQRAMPSLNFSIDAFAK